MMGDKTLRLMLVDQKENEKLNNNLPIKNVSGLKKIFLTVLLKQLLIYVL